MPQQLEKLKRWGLGGGGDLPYTSPDLHKFSSGRIAIFNILNILHLLVVESIDTKPSYAKGCMHPKCLDKNQSKKLSNFWFSLRTKKFF